MEGTVFDIKEFTVHDGPGPRITVFLKGCPLRCRWCHNPEGLTQTVQLMEKTNLCTHCGRCRILCDHLQCKPFGRCIQACATGCLSLVGETVSSDELAQKLLQKAALLKQMGGGITISGGEPMLQPEFVCALAEALGGVHKAIQTSGFAAPEVYQRVVGHFDYVMQDIKLADNEAHRRYTGVDNAQILENIRWLQESGKAFVFRVPLIPGITDTEENLLAISRIVGSCRTELLPYNPMAGAKYPMVGMAYSLAGKENRPEDYTRYFENAVLLA